MKFEKKLTKHGFYSVYPLPSSEEMEKYFSEKYFQAPDTKCYQISYTPLEIKHKKMKSELLFYSLTKSGYNNGKLLELGPGEGFFLDVANKKGIDIVGVDFSDFGIIKFHPELSKFLIKNDVYVAMREFLSYGRKFELILADSVIEHLLDPEAFFELALDLLDTNGLLCLSFPNNYSAYQKLLLDKGYIKSEFWYVPHAHFHYFTSKSMENLASSYGFEVKDCYSDFPIDLFLLNESSNYIKYKNLGKHAHKARVEIDLFLSETGFDNYLSLLRSMATTGIGRNLTMIFEKKII
ncbi:class I SAM-dependent methyltransferase [Leptospira jelokensis]|uniref:Class I SAM-dependent methyltransferase n=1 Tax=Leptospira jelokensis TaxID=2484931 RepID=A0A4Z0ZZJ9_9LEPT|nr:class I SAM-dependent methyltransferase [Leptospira jelokensis]TGL66373.1 class I SAM-dependent methyltransferase [Leptospira jelokensis]